MGFQNREIWDMKKKYFAPWFQKINWYFQECNKTFIYKSKGNLEIIRNQKIISLFQINIICSFLRKVRENFQLNKLLKKLFNHRFAVPAHARVCTCRPHCIYFTPNQISLTHFPWSYLSWEDLPWNEKYIAMLCANENLHRKINYKIYQGVSLFFSFLRNVFIDEN